MESSIGVRFSLVSGLREGSGVWRLVGEDEGGSVGLEKVFQRISMSTRMCVAVQSSRTRVRSGSCQV